MTLLQASCFEILCLRSALRYNVHLQAFPLRNEELLSRADLMAQPDLGLILASLFSYASRLQELQLSEAEVALLAATWILQSSRPDLREPERIEAYQDSVTAMAIRLSGEEFRWHKTLLTRPPPLKGFSVGQEPDKSVIYVSIEQPQETRLPISLVHLFEEQ